jgi:hypothetical protein
MVGSAIDTRQAAIVSRLDDFLPILQRAKKLFGEKLRENY